MTSTEKNPRATILVAIEPKDTSPSRDARHGFDSLYPRYKGGYPLKFTLGQRREIAMSKPAERDLPFSAGSLSKLAEFLVAEVPYL